MKLLSLIVVLFGLTACGKSVNPDTLVTTNIKGWSAGGFGLVILANFEIKNNTDKPVKDVTIRCGGYSESGTRIDENIRTIYKVIPANAKLRINEFNMGYVNSQVQRLSCVTTKFENG
jgi:hypothetical protein